MKLIIVHTFQTASLFLHLLLPRRALGLEHRPLSLIPLPGDAANELPNRAQDVQTRDRSHPFMKNKAAAVAAALGHPTTAHTKRSNSWFVGAETLDWLQTVAERLGGESATRGVTQVVSRQGGDLASKTGGHSEASKAVKFDLTQLTEDSDDQNDDRQHASKGASEGVKSGLTQLATDIGARNEDASSRQHAGSSASKVTVTKPAHLPAGRGSFLQRIPIVKMQDSFLQEGSETQSETDAERKRLVERIRKDIETDAAKWPVEAPEQNARSPSLAPIDQVSEMAPVSAPAALPLAPAGNVWIIRESSNKTHAPLQSAYVPDPRDSFSSQEGSPWKMVRSVSRGAALVVELITVEQWSKEVDVSNSPFSTRESHSPAWLASLAAKESAVRKALNDTVTQQAVAVEVAEDSPFIAQHVMPMVIAIRRIPSAFGQRLSGVAAVVSNMGLVTAQILATTFLVGLLILFLIVDKSYQRDEKQQEADDQKKLKADWWAQLTSWEAGVPGVEYNEGDCHLG